MLTTAAATEGPRHRGHGRRQIAATYLRRCGVNAASGAPPHSCCCSIVLLQKSGRLSPPTEARHAGRPIGRRPPGTRRGRPISEGRPENHDDRKHDSQNGVMLPYLGRVFTKDGCPRSTGCRAGRGGAHHRAWLRARAHTRAWQGAPRQLKGLCHPQPAPDSAFERGRKRNNLICFLGGVNLLIASAVVKPRLGAV